MEAEAVAFVVTRAAGLDGLVRSSDYIQLYGGDKELFLASLSHIQRVASDLIGSLLAKSAVTTSSTQGIARDSCWTL